MSLRRKKRNLQNYNFETFDEYLVKTVGPDGGFEILKDNQTQDVAETASMFQNIMAQHDEVHANLMNLKVFIEWELPT